MVLIWKSHCIKVKIVNFVWAPYRRDDWGGEGKGLDHPERFSRFRLKIKMVHVMCTLPQND